MRVIVVEDSELANKELVSMLEKYPNIEIIASCQNATDAKKQIESLHPDLIFLDIQMPDYDGFTLLEKLQFIPEVIFTTAYDEYAIRAYEYNALDYLLKPIKKERLDKVIEKSRRKINRSSEQESLSLNSKVFIKDGESCWFVNLSDITLIEAQGAYTKICFLDKKPLILRSLTHIESRLDDKVFFRANRSQIINLHHITDVDLWFNGKLKVKLKDKFDVEISRRQSIKFKKRMSF